MNSNVKEFLNRYIADPDPRYAVALRGSWGCGKTYFVDEWVEELKEAYTANPEDPNSITLEPVHVSLYGMRSIQEVVAAIDRQLRPFMHSKLMKFGKGALKLLGKAAFNINLDLDGNPDTDDASISMSLDSLSVLFNKDKEVVKGDKLLVFDDIERSNIDLKELLGFINSFVERGACHVVIVGDFTKLSEESEQLLKDFKEKTIGRTFSIVAETENATDSFLAGRSGWLQDKRDLILECFQATGTNNLRLLRQAIRDVDSILGEFDQFNVDSNFLEGFLLTFIAITTLYNTSRYHDVLKEYSKARSTALADDKEKRAIILELQDKYRPLLHNYGHQVLDTGNIHHAVRYLEYGTPFKDYLRERMAKETRQLTLLEKLSLYSVMEDEEFNRLYAELEEKLLTGSIRFLTDLGRGVDLLCMFDSLGIHTLDGRIKPAVERTVSEELNTMRSADAVETSRIMFNQGMMGSLMDHTLKQELKTAVDSLVGDRLRTVPNKMQILLRNLNKENVFKLRDVDKEATPDRQSAYELSAVFEFESGDAIFEALKGLDNQARTVFRDFLYSHYHLGSVVISGDNSRFQPDMRCLGELKARVDAHITSLPQSLSRFTYEQLQDTLAQIIHLGGQPIATGPSVTQIEAASRDGARS